MRSVPEFPFAAYLADIKREVDAELARFLGVKVDEARTLGPCAEAVVSTVAELTLRGGKRLRPALAALAYEACGGRGGTRPVLGAGLALELLQTYFLIHDDWMDGDATRRGGASAHVLLADRLGSAHRGASAAILAGDHACALA